MLQNPRMQKVLFGTFGDLVLKEESIKQKWCEAVFSHLSFREQKCFRDLECKTYYLVPWGISFSKRNPYHKNLDLSFFRRFSANYRR